MRATTSNPGRMIWFAMLGSFALNLYLYYTHRQGQLYSTTAVSAANYLYSGTAEPASASPETPTAQPLSQSGADVIDLYIRTLAASITGYALQTAAVVKGATGIEIAEQPFNDKLRKFGRDWPRYGYTMVGMHRLGHLRTALETVLGVGAVDSNDAGGAISLPANIAGDYLECGVWRGGASIFATGVLTAWTGFGAVSEADASREVHVCDSFNGLPQASTAADHNEWNEMHYLEVSLATVRSNFARFDLLLEERVHFHVGYFQFSLPRVRADLVQRQRRLAVLRLDGDMYESTLDELFNLYDLVSVGGFILIDDWSIPVCRSAVEDFMKMHGITTAVVEDADVAYWRKTADVVVDYDWYVNWNSTRHIAGAKKQQPKRQIA
ncbi:hypothetical protein PVAG01_09871 [Phlyctema vagabunda]|uniref:Uncharacterized protein n=1 Tax=Phlyctema vagabunda TaxID=108571 RepID=A0ABR4P4A8_9HELO